MIARKNLTHHLTRRWGVALASLRDLIESRRSVRPNPNSKDPCRRLTILNATHHWIDLDWMSRSNVTRAILAMTMFVDSGRKLAVTPKIHWKIVVDRPVGSIAIVAIGFVSLGPPTNRIVFAPTIENPMSLAGSVVCRLLSRRMVHPVDRHRQSHQEEHLALSVFLLVAGSRFLVPLRPDRLVRCHRRPRCPNRIDSQPWSPVNRATSVVQRLRSHVQAMARYTPASAPTRSRPVHRSTIRPIRRLASQLHVVADIDEVPRSWS